MYRLGLCLVALFSLAAASPAAAEPVLLISIDGLRPEDVFEADKRGLAIPNLRRFVTEGAWASVAGVLPTVTYPSHVTLVTGASPAKHGVVSNTTFDPMQINHGGWFWYASDIKVSTLWEGAASAGLKTANVHWPVSVAAKAIDWNLPQIWRSGHSDDAKLLAALATPGLVTELESAVGSPYAAGIDESIEGDENRGRFAVELIGRHRPDFATVYLTAFDHEQHVQGPGTAAAHAVLERIDAIVGRLVAAERAAHPDSVIAIVSDHGFSTIAHELSLHRAFIDAGLITLDANGKIGEWDAMPWPSGGSVAIVLSRPEDTILVGRVRALLDRLKADPANHVAAVAERNEIAAMGGNPDASFYVDLAPDTTAAGFNGASAPIVAPSKYKGMHGYFPRAKAMRSTFLVMGQGVAQGRGLGEIDMRAIAPTLAQVLGFSLPDAERPPLDLRPGSR